MYKVVFQDKNGCYGPCNKLYSCCKNSDIVDNSIRVEYQVGRWSYPRLKGSKLFVFKELQDAQNMIIKFDWADHLIYKCMVRNPLYKTESDVYIYDWLNSYTQKVWQEYVNVRKSKQKTMIPVLGCFIHNTVFCSAVKLVGEPIAF